MNIIGKLNVFTVLILSIPFITGCGDTPLETAIDYKKTPGPTITTSNVTGDIYYDSMYRTGSISFNYSQDKTGYYSIRIYDSGNSYVSGTGLNAWISYETANQAVSVTIWGPASSSGKDMYFNNSGSFTVQIRARDINNHESTLSLSFTVAPLNAVLVRGAGSDFVNGWYSRITSFTFNLPSTVYTVYYQKSGTTIYYMSIDDMMPGWHVHEGTAIGSYIGYYNNSSSSSLPVPTSGWSVGSGTSPVPSSFYTNAP